MRLLKSLPMINLIFSLALASLLIVLVINGRNAAARRNEGLRTFICYFESAVLKSPQTPARRAITIRFFNGVAEKLHEPPCSIQRSTNADHPSP